MLYISLDCKVLFALRMKVGSDERVCLCPVKEGHRTSRLKGPAGAGPDDHSGSKRPRQKDKGSKDGNEQKKSKPSPAKPAKKKGPLDSFFIKNPA